MPGNGLCLKSAFSRESFFFKRLWLLWKMRPLFTENMPPATATLWHLCFPSPLVNLTWFQFSSAPLLSALSRLPSAFRAANLTSADRPWCPFTYVYFQEGGEGWRWPPLPLFLVDDSLVLATGQWTHHVTSWVTVLFPNKGRPGWNWHSPFSRAQRGPLRLKRIRCCLVWECVSGWCRVSALT